MFSSRNLIFFLFFPYCIYDSSQIDLGMVWVYDVRKGSSSFFFHLQKSNLQSTIYCKCHFTGTLLVNQVISDTEFYTILYFCHIILNIITSQVLISKKYPAYSSSSIFFSCSWHFVFPHTILETEYHFPYLIKPAGISIEIVLILWRL